MKLAVARRGSAPRGPSRQSPRTLEELADADTAETAGPSRSQSRSSATNTVHHHDAAETHTTAACAGPNGSSRFTAGERVAYASRVQQRCKLGNKTQQGLFASCKLLRSNFSHTRQTGQLHKARRPKAGPLCSLWLGKRTPARDLGAPFLHRSIPFDFFSFFIALSTKQGRFADTSNLAASLTILLKKKVGEKRKLISKTRLNSRGVTRV